MYLLISVGVIVWRISKMVSNTNIGSAIKFEAFLALCIYLVSAFLYINLLSNTVKEQLLYHQFVETEQGFCEKILKIGSRRD